MSCGDTFACLSLSLSLSLCFFFVQERFPVSNISRTPVQAYIPTYFCVRVSRPDRSSPQPLSRVSGGACAVRHAAGAPSQHAAHHQPGGHVCQGPDDSADRVLAAFPGTVHATTARCPWTFKNTPDRTPHIRRQQIVPPIPVSADPICH